jgi:hypothetical protein
MTQLTPVASPIDTFISPSARPNPNVPESLQLAEALSQFVPSLRGFTGLLGEQRIQQGEVDARKLMDERRYKSIEELRGAVSRGEIREDQNPWKMVFLKKLTAREQIRTGLLKIEEEFSNSQDPEVQQVRQSQSIESYDSWLNGRISEVTKGMDGWALEAVQDMAEGWKTNTLAHQQNVWENQRNASTLLGIQRESSAIVAAALTESKVSGVEVSSDGVSALQALVDSSSKTVLDPEKIRHQVIQGIADAAIGAKSFEGVEQLMSAVTLNGKSLRALDAGEIADIREMVDDAAWEDQTRSAIAEERAEKESVDQAFKALGNAYTNGSEIDINQVVAGLPADRRLQVLETHKRLSAMSERGTYGDVTDPVIFDHLESMANDPKMSPNDKINFLFEQTQAGRVSQEDFKAYTKTFRNQGEPESERVNSRVSYWKGVTRSAVELAVYSSERFSNEMAGAMQPGESAAVKAKYDAEIDQYVLRIQRTADDYLVANRGKVNDAELNRVLSEQHGEIVNTYVKSTKDESTQQAVTSYVKSPEKMVEAGRLKVEKGRYLLDGETPVPPPPPPKSFKEFQSMFTNPTVEGSAEDQIKHTNLMLQGLPDPERVKAVDWIRRQSFGDDVVDAAYQKADSLVLRTRAIASDLDRLARLGVLTDPRLRKQFDKHREMYSIGVNAISLSKRYRDESELNQFMSDADKVLNYIMPLESYQK